MTREPPRDDRRFYGKYAGVVFDNMDPKRLGRIKALVEEVGFVTDPTDWAYPCAAPYGGAMNTGQISVPNVGMNVWMEFESGDPCRPIWTGVYWSEPQGVAETPLLAQGIPDITALPPKGLDIAIKADGSVMKEPAPPFRAVYPDNQVIKTRGGITIEIDDTPLGERIHLWHPRGSFLEFHPMGQVVQRVTLGRYTLVLVQDQLHVIGNHDVAIEGDATLHVRGNYTVHVEGDKKEIIDGDLIQQVNGLGGAKQLVPQGPINRTSGVGTTDTSGNNQHF
jgi:hypothetical protein